MSPTSLPTSQANGALLPILINSRESVVPNTTLETCVKIGCIEFWSRLTVHLKFQGHLICGTLEIMTDDWSIIGGYLGFLRLSFY